MNTVNGKARCRVGDLALVVSSKDTPENIGRIVKVLRLATDEDCFLNTTDGVVWVVASQGQPLLCHIEDEHGNLCESFLDMERPYRDSCLLPLRPEPFDESSANALAISPVVEVNHG